MRRCATTSGRVDPSSVRIEEYLNYFTFDYPEPTGEETLAINAEASACPWAPDHLLLRLGLKGKSIPESQIPAANYILLIDTSGSMSGSDRMDLVKTGLCAMVDAMRPDDRIAIITYSGSVQKLVESTLISTGASAIKAAIRGLFASGGTAGGPAMKMAYEEASAHYIEGGNNRIIMCTDGDFNVGVSSTDALVKMVESYQKSGIYLSIMGFGTGNYQDSRMESLSNHGNGTYNYIDSEQEMIKVFVNERSHFWAVANDSKCQVRFNPEAVAEYRLLGYENRLMSQEEFEDSSKDAGEIGAGQTVTALYEIIPAEGYTKNASLATFETRYKFSLKDTESRSLTTEVKVSDTASENMNFAAGVAAYAMVLRNSMYKGKATLSLAKELVSGASTYDPDGFRAELLGLMEIVRP
jgi:Ca-activated chloride channel family protein